MSNTTGWHKLILAYQNREKNVCEVSFHIFQYDNLMKRAFFFHIDK